MDNPFARFVKSQDTEDANAISRKRPFTKRAEALETIEKRENANRATGADDPIQLDKWQERKRQRIHQENIPLMERLRRK